MSFWCLLISWEEKTVLSPPKKKQYWSCVPFLSNMLSIHIKNIIFLREKTHRWQNFMPFFQNILHFFSREKTHNKISRQKKIKAYDIVLFFSFSKELQDSWTEKEPLKVSKYKETAYWHWSMTLLCYYCSHIYLHSSNF